MKKNSRLKSFFAILLAVSMIFQQSSLTVLATDDTYVEDATATPTPSESEAEAYTTEGAEPVAEKQEEPQQMQETPAAEQAQEPTEAPAEQPTEAPAEQPTEAPAEQPTEAPAEQPTEAPAAAPTETPATEPTAAPAAEVTEVPAAPEATATPAAEATATPTPEVSASPSETPTPAPTETPKTSFRYEDSRVVITATAPEDANLPQDAEIKADYIAPGTDRYNAAVTAFNSQLSSQLGLDDENTEAEYVLYDVYFLTADGSRIEPESGNVKVDMSFKKIQESTVDGDVVNKDVVHLDNDGQAEVVTEYVNTNTDGEITSMGFTQDSFSIVGGVTVYTEPQDAIKPMANTAVTDLKKLLTNAEIYGAEVDADGKFHVLDNVDGYEIKLYFAEKYDEQFADSDTMYYQLPAGVVPENVNGQTFSITIVDADGTSYIINGNTYSIGADGKLAVKFNQSDENFSKLTGAANVKFNLRLNVKFAKNEIKDKIDFGQDIVKNVLVEEKHDLSVTKEGKLDSDGKMHYTIVVTSTGNNSNVDIHDVISGDILKFNQDVTMSSDKGIDLSSVVPDYQENNGFKVTIPNMQHGERITLTYTADVDYDKVGLGKVSEDNKKNSVSVKSTEHPDEIKKDYIYPNEISYSDVIKKSNTGTVGDDSKKTIDWSVDVNSKKLISVAKQTIKDSIAEGSRDIMHYSGTGITILVTKEDGTTETRNVAWNQLENVQRDEKGIISWEYPVPDTDGKYSYHITYTTEVDMNKVTGDIDVTNTASVGDKTTSDSTTVKPGTENGAGVKKEVVSSSQKEVEWKITVTVPANGLNKCEVVDTLPSAYINGQHYYDDLLNNGVSVSGLLAGEDYRISNPPIGSDGKKNVVFTFYYTDVNKTEYDGLKPSEDRRKREIVINLKTKVNQNWLDEKDLLDWQLTHENSVLLRADKNEFKGSARTVISKEKITKSFKKLENVTIGGKQYPAFKFELILLNATKDDFNIEDKFDTDIFQYFNPLDGDKRISIIGGDQYFQGNTEGGIISAKDTEDGMTINVKQLPRDKNGNICPQYNITYWLIVKNEKAFNDLLSKTLPSGNSEFKNTVTWGKVSDSISFGYTYKPIEKKEIGDSPSATNHYTVNYEININKLGALLNSGKDITVTDTISDNMRFLPETLKVYVDGALVNAEYNVNDKIMTVVVPDGKPVRIIYSTRILAKQGTSSVSYSNTVKVTGYDGNAQNNSQATISTDGEGTGTIPSIKIHKHIYGNTSASLRDAVFALYKYVGENRIPVVDKDGKQVIVKTGENGSATLTGHKTNDGWAFIEGDKYCLIETTAPAGYAVDSTPVDFIIKDVAQGEDDYVSGDTIQISNATENFRIVKKDDKDSSKTLAGAVFELIGKIAGKDQTIEITTDNDGIAAFSKLEPGSYILKEKIAPEGYKLDNKSYTIVIGEDLKVSCEELHFTENAGIISADIGNEQEKVETTEVRGKKIWSDGNNRDGKRPSDITLKLYEQVESGEKTEVKDAVPTWDKSGNEWSYSYSNLPKYKEGKLITYSVEEVNVPEDYESSQDGNNIINTHTPENISIKGYKYWNDKGNEISRPKEINIRLLANGKEVASKIVTKADDWKWKFENQPKYENGQEIEYTITEDKVDGYITTKGTGKYDVINTPTKVTIEKIDAIGNLLPGATFEIQDKDGKVIDTWTTSTKDNPHVITGKLILGETYKLVEKSAPAGYTLADPVEFTVSEKDIDNKVEMKNTYSASGSLNLTAKKALTTTETPLAAGQFTFELRDKDGKVLQTKTNDADGNITFDEIKYSLVKDAAYKDNTDKKVDDTGEYQYTVNEVKGDAAGYTYDDTIYTINVTVTDAGNGTLTVTPVIHSSKATSEDATVTGMEFTNTYTTSGQIALGATKTLEGQTLEAEQFSFQATEMDADGKAVENGYSETVKNADGGAITFPIITYKESGTHYYQITEVKDEKPAYQYDESKYVVKVDVTDDNAGKLTAKVTSVTKNGEPVKSEDLTGAVTFTNTYSASADLELKAQKSMKVEAEQLGTFEFELKDADGKVIETVKNDEKGAISFSKLSYTEKDAGETFTYTVNEKLPSEADTYVYDKTVYTVTVNVEDNRDGTLKLTTKVNGEDYTETAMKFVNDTTKVTISKVDDTTLKALAGAKLQVVDDQDKVVEEWTSDGTPHVLTAKLVLGKTYKLVEAEAPLGYEIAEPITFTVDADDTKNAVEMKDAMTKSKTAAIEITKELKLNDALAGAKDMTFYAALFADAECTIPASDVKALEFKNASSSTVTFTNLDLGRTYYVSETDVTGKAIDSGMTPDEKVYVPVYPQGQAITVTEDGAKSSITFENQFSEWPDGFYKIATLNVTKKLLGADGNALESDKIFYAGIFDDKECTTLSTRTEKNILILDLAGGSTVSESTQAVVIPDESFTLYVAETDAEGNLVGGTDGFRYAVTVENGNVLFDENNLNAEVTIINQEQPEATPTVTPEETITPTPTPGTSTGVKTGDDTPIGFYMALLFVAALAIEETIRRRRKKEQD